MRVLVTRPLDDAGPTATELARLGHDALIAPLFVVRFSQGPEIVHENAQAILVTSGNGVRALCRRSKHRDVPLFAVGTHTAALARSAGFENVIDAEGDSAALAREVLYRLRPKEGPLVLVRAKHASPELEIALGSAGFEVVLSTAYEAAAVSELPPKACQALRSRSLDATLLFSPRSAAVFAACVRHSGLADSCTGLLACCISKSAAFALDGLRFGEVRIAARPDQDHLLALLGSDLP